MERQTSTSTRRRHAYRRVVVCHLVASPRVAARNATTTTATRSHVHCRRGRRLNHKISHPDVFPLTSPNYLLFFAEADVLPMQCTHVLSFEERMNDDVSVACGRSSSSSPLLSELAIAENDCHIRSDALERLQQRGQSLAQVAVAMHQQMGAAAVADTTDIMLWLLSIVPHVTVLPFAIKLSQLPPDLSAEDQADAIRRHVATLAKGDRVLAILAASRVGDGSAIVFDVLLTAVAKRLLVCLDPASELSAVDRENVLTTVEAFLGPSGQLLADWEAEWVELLDSFHGNRDDAMLVFLDAV